MDNVINKKIDNDGCEIIEVKFGNGNVGIGLGAISDALKVQLFQLDSEYTLGDEVNADDAKKAWDGCKTLVELTFPTVESIENFIQVLDDYKHKHFHEIPEEPKKRATNRQLAKWCAEGNGQIHYIGAANTHSFYSYQHEIDEIYVTNDVMVRKWDDTEWHEPDVQYMGLEG